MKKLLCLLFTAFLCIPTAINAAEEPTKNTPEIIELENGYYLEITLTEEPAVGTRATYAKTGTKTVTFRNSEGAKVWDVTLTASFTYTGTSAICTSATPSYRIYNDTWKVTANASRAGSTATLRAIGKQYFGNVLLGTINESISIKCSPTGVLS